jgi:pimeloyl-ACP methyl ester carboxylesterase
MELLPLIETPRLRHYFGEARIVGAWMRGRRAEDRLAAAYPGDGRGVIVIPGLFTNDNRTAMLRRVLNKAGYQCFGWGLGRNMPIRADVLDRFAVQVEKAAQLSGGPVALVGWSLGGLVARSYAHQAPDEVHSVITLGSPFSGHPRSNRAWPFYELVADHKVDKPPITHDFSIKPPVPTTAIWSPRDGIIAASAARGEAHQRDHQIEINCGHFSMSSAPDALEAVLKALSSRT